MSEPKFFEGKICVTTEDEAAEVVKKLSDAGFDVQAEMYVRVQALPEAWQKLAASALEMHKECIEGKAMCSTARFALQILQFVASKERAHA